MTSSCVLLLKCSCATTTTTTTTRGNLHCYSSTAKHVGPCCINSDILALCYSEALPHVCTHMYIHVQTALSLLASCTQDAASQLAINHAALCHFGTAAKLAAFVNRSDLSESAARHAWNVCASSGLLSCGLTCAALIPQLKAIAGALNATRTSSVPYQVICSSLNPLTAEFITCLIFKWAYVAQMLVHVATEGVPEYHVSGCCSGAGSWWEPERDMLFHSSLVICCLCQVSCNILLLKCLVAAGDWGAARRHVEALQRCLPLKSTAPAAAAALVQVAGWRAACLVHASLTVTPRVGEDMNRLLSELNTPGAKVREFNGDRLRQMLLDKHHLRTAEVVWSDEHIQLLNMAAATQPAALANYVAALFAFQAYAWLAFAQACSNKADQLSARKAAIAALEGLPLKQVRPAAGVILVGN